MGLLQSTFLFARNTFRRWWVLLLLVVNSIPSFFNKILSPLIYQQVGTLEMPIGWFPYIVWGAVIISACGAYHDLRTDNLVLLTKLKTVPRSRYDLFKSFLTGSISHIDKLISSPELTKSDLFKWRNTTFDGIALATGHDVLDKQCGETMLCYRIQEWIDQLPSDSPNLDIYRDILRRCRKRIEELPDAIRPQHITTSFDPNDLPRWEDM